MLSRGHAKSAPGLDLPGRMDLHCPVCSVCVVWGGGGVGGWKQREVEERGGRERGEYRVGGRGCFTPGVSLKASISMNYELYLHAGCQETQCRHVSGSVSYQPR